MSEEPELDRLTERLEAAFRAAHARPGFQEELLERVRARRARTRPGIDTTQLGALAALFLVVLGVGFAISRITHGAPTAGTANSASGSAPAPAHGAQADSAFGPLPRPAAPGPQAGLPALAAPAASGAGVALHLPASAPVLRYAEPAAADADAFAAARSARPTTAASTARIYQADAFSLTVLPTSPAAGTEPSFVLTPRGREPDGSGPPPEAAQAAALRFLAEQHLPAPEPRRVAVTTQPNLPTVVRFIPQVGGYDVVTAAGTPAGLTVVVRPDGSVFQASGPLPLSFDTASYRLASFEALARAAGPGYTGAVLVYALGFDGAHGYLEPAVLFTGAERSLLVPAVEPGQLR